MKKKLMISMGLLLGFILTFSGCSQRNYPLTNRRGVLEISETQLESSLRQTVGLVSRASSGRFSCTGVIIHPMYVLTAEHCIDNDQHLMFGTIEGPDPMGEMHNLVTYEMFKAHGFENTVLYEVVAYSDPLDLAILRRRSPITGRYDVARLRSQDNLRIGDYMYAIGHPVGITYNFSDGFFSSESRVLGDNEADRIYTSVHVYYGNSGGPLFDGNGDLSGIISMMVGSPHLNSAVNFTTIREFLHEHLPDSYLSMRSYSRVDENFVNGF